MHSPIINKVRDMIAKSCIVLAISITKVRDMIAKSSTALALAR